mgnify:CR=1 FL=1
MLLEGLLALVDVGIDFVNGLLNFLHLVHFLLDKLRVALHGRRLLIFLVTECIFFENCFLVVLYLDISLIKKQLSLLCCPSNHIIYLTF